jgi:hypothetical protein
VAYPLLFGNVTLELSDGSDVLSWPAEIGFSDARIPYVLIGNYGCLEFFDAMILGWAREVELRANFAFP